MRDLDTRAQGLMKDIDKLADDYLKNMKKESMEKKKEQLGHIQSLFNKAKEYGDDKVQLAIQTYELVDKHIRRLDSDLARFEAEIQDKALSSSRAQEESGASKKGRKKLKEKEKRKKGTTGASSEDESKSTRKKQKKGEIFIAVIFCCIRIVYSCLFYRFIHLYICIFVRWLFYLVTQLIFSQQRYI